MGRRRRHFDKNTLYVVKNICLYKQARFTPTPELEERIRGLLTKYVTRYKIKLVSFIFTPSGFKLYLLSPEQNLHKFMCLLQTNISKDVNKLQERTGPVFAGRYSAEPVLEDEQEEVMREIIAQVCMDDLVAHPEDWGGASSWAAQLSGEEIVGHRVDRALFWRLRRAPEYYNTPDFLLEQMATIEYRVKLTPLPIWADLSHAERAKKIQEFAESAAELRRSAYAAQALEYDEKPDIPGLKEVLASSSYDHYDLWKPMRRGYCHTMDEEQIEAFYKAREERDEQYDDAARRLRRGEEDIYFPEGMIPPGHLHCVGSPSAIASGQNPQRPDDPAEQDELSA